MTVGDPGGNQNRTRRLVSVRLPSARRRSLDPRSRSRETPSLAGAVETDGYLDNERAQSEGGAGGSDTELHLGVFHIN